MATLAHRPRKTSHLPPKAPDASPKAPEPAPNAPERPPDRRVVGLLGGAAIALVGLLLNGMVMAVRRRVLFWDASQKGDMAAAAAEKRPARATAAAPVKAELVS